MWGGGVLCYFGFWVVTLFGGGGRRCESYGFFFFKVDLEVGGGLKRWGEEMGKCGVLEGMGAFGSKECMQRWGIYTRTIPETSKPRVLTSEKLSHRKSIS